MLFRFFNLILCFFILLPVYSFSHETRPSIAKIQFQNNQVFLEISTNIEVFLANIDASVTSDTSEAPEAKLYDQARLLNSQQLKTSIRAVQENLLNKLYLKSENIRLELSLDELIVEEIDDLDLPRLTQLFFSANLTGNENHVTFSWEKTLGALAIRQVGNESEPQNESYAAWLQPGEKTEKIYLHGQVSKTSKVFAKYVSLGFTHIIPKGLDHIVFILGLFFFSTKLRPLVGQVTVFTIAHSVTLVMASLGWITVSSDIIEPLIALSIAWIGFENIFRPKLGISRLTVIFIFGLLHGLGFASVLGDLGLESSAFLLSLLAFNVGVEFGQLSVLGPFLLISPFFTNRIWYRKVLANPISALIGFTGLYWTFERLGFF